MVGVHFVLETVERTGPSLPSRTTRRTCLRSESNKDRRGESPILPTSVPGFPGLSMGTRPESEGSVMIGETSCLEEGVSVLR